jgi:LmbE family N-acetylglucosaminyl deacetylase
MKIGFIIAHPDDEAYGPFGTIHKLLSQGHKVLIFCICNGARPNNEQVSKFRLKSFKENCFNLGVEFKIWDNDDLTLEIDSVTSLVEDIVETNELEIVYTHNISDINRDHRILAEAVMVACRPKLSSRVKKLYFFEVPSSTDWSFNQLQPTFQPNEYVEIDSDVMELKKSALKRYNTETYQSPDARSLESMITLAKYRGHQVGVNYAESFKLIFSIV